MSDLTLAELRAEMARLTRIMMRSNLKYLEREEEVKLLHQQEANGYTGNLRTVMANDVLLNEHSSVAKTCGLLAGAMAQVIMAEIEYARAMAPRSEAARQRIQDLNAAHRAAMEEAGGRRRRGGGGPLLEPPIATRPQDWAQPARSILFGPERERA